MGTNTRAASRRSNSGEGRVTARNKFWFMYHKTPLGGIVQAQSCGRMWAMPFIRGVRNHFVATYGMEG
jgi:hypothetical protein